MRLPITILVLILCFSSCKEKAEKKSEPKVEETELQTQPTEKVDLTKVPDSLELIADKNLIGDFNGDDKTDFASLVKNKNNGKIGILMIHKSNEQEKFVFGAGKEVHDMTDLKWIETFEKIDKGVWVMPDLIDEKTGDILGPDESKSFQLIGEGISTGVKEYHGGGILFWNGKEYIWYHYE